MCFFNWRCCCCQSTHAHTLSLSLCLSATLLSSPFFMFDWYKNPVLHFSIECLSIEIQISTHTLVLISKVSSIRKCIFVRKTQLSTFFKRPLASLYFPLRKFCLDTFSSSGSIKRNDPASETRNYARRRWKASFINTYHYNQGMLTEREGSVQLTSSLRSLVFETTVKNVFNINNGWYKLASTWRSTVLSLPLQKGFPATTINGRLREEARVRDGGGWESKRYKKVVEKWEILKERETKWWKGET